MIDALASDVAVTWLGAVGCGLYLHFLWSRREAGAGTGLFLFGVLTALLAVRGFYWLFGGTQLAQLVFAAATLLPIAMTLFAEHLVRRHHPLWLKLLALGVSVVFFVINLFTDLSGNTPLLLTFLGCFAVVTASNGWFLLWLRDADLSDNEERLARAVVVVVALAVPLAATDFREELGPVPVRLGALGALAFVYVFLNLSESQRVVRGLVAHIAAALLFAVVLASVMALASRGPGPGFAEAGLRGMPVAIAWVLLTAILSAFAPFRWPVMAARFCAGCSTPGWIRQRVSCIRSGTCRRPPTMWCSATRSLLATPWTRCSRWQEGGVSPCRSATPGRGPGSGKAIGSRPRSSWWTCSSATK